MKGIVFTEFLEMVEKEFGYDTVDQIIEDSKLPSGGIYTAVGTYPHAELVSLVKQLHLKTGIPLDVLLKTYGRYLHNTFTLNYTHFFEAEKTLFDFLESIDEHIHVEVLKLYPDAQLPKFETRRISDNELEMIYTSERKLSDFAEGLIEKSMEHYKQKGSIKRSFINEDGSKVRFNVIIDE
ncbi:MAG: heme NO-binding domain-containing protein [Bacteroidia bacterium]|nr:heme NO-binding domain-containing protein [Bacteroidia bacterium]MBT8230855.1 heme NO-binding domain-containing protein [Bacteroidia bacterium]NNK90246.1 heme NO-binding domain-containing protein [Saprospiraceae bacterium]